MGVKARLKRPGPARAGSKGLVSREGGSTPQQQLSSHARAKKQAASHPSCRRASRSKEEKGPSPSGKDRSFPLAGP